MAVVVRSYTLIYDDSSNCNMYTITIHYDSTSSITISWQLNVYFFTFQLTLFTFPGTAFALHFHLKKDVFTYESSFFTL
jgi:hypothetical protein